MEISGTSKKIHWYVFLILAVFAAGACLLPLGERPLIRPDEYRYAEIPREMLASGDWVVPRMNGIRYFEKPGLGYQLTALSFALFGENAFALRLPSLLAFLLSAAFLRILAAKESRDPWFPGLCTGCFLLCGMPLGVSLFAVLDSQLSCALTICIVSFYLACRTDRKQEVIPWLILSGAAAGAAFLIKGFLAFAVPVLTLLPFLVWQKEWKKLFLYPWIPFFVMLLVILPWSAAIHRAEPDFWRYFFIEEHLHRFTSSTHDSRPKPFWYLFPFLAGGMLPAGLLWICGWKGIRRDWIRDPFIRFLLCWTILPFLFFSSSSCKLGTYILPCFPPLAVLTAAAFRRSMLAEPGRTAKILHLLRKFFGTVFLIAAPIGFYILLFPKTLPFIPPLYSGFTIWPYLVLVSAAVAGIVLLRMKHTRIFPLIGSFLLMLIPALIFGQKSIPPEVQGIKMPEATLRKCLKEVPIRKGDIVAAGRREAPVLAWELKRDDIIVVGDPGEMQYGFRNYKEYSRRIFPEVELMNRLKDYPEGHFVYVAMDPMKKLFYVDKSKIKKAVSIDGITVIRF